MGLSAARTAQGRLTASNVLLLTLQSTHTDITPPRSPIPGGLQAVNGRPLYPWNTVQERSSPRRALLHWSPADSSNGSSSDDLDGVMPLSLTPGAAASRQAVFPASPLCIVRPASNSSDAHEVLGALNLAGAHPDVCLSAARDQLSSPLSFSQRRKLLQAGQPMVYALGASPGGG
jgi:hypothetical protein